MQHTSRRTITNFLCATGIRFRMSVWPPNKTDGRGFAPEICAGQDCPIIIDESRAVRH